MVVPFMFRRTIISVFITVTLRMADIAIDFTALTGLDRMLTVGEGGGILVGEDMADIDIGFVFNSMTQIVSGGVSLRDGDG
jgi:hypothetical protein